MFWGRDRSQQTLHERAVASTILRARGEREPILESRKPDHPDVHAECGALAFDLEITDAAPEHELAARHAQIRFDRELGSVYRALAEPDRARFREAFGGAYIWTEFAQVPPKDGPRNATALLHWMADHPNLAEHHDFQSEMPWTPGAPEWVPPILGLRHLATLNRTTASDEPRFAEANDLVADVLDPVRAAIQKKIEKTYMPCTDRILGVYLMFLPSRLQRELLREEFEKSIAAASFTELWFATDDDAVILTDDKHA